MLPEAWIVRYAYPVIFAGAFVEGETVLVIAGLLAQQNRIAFPGVITAGFLGAYCGHLFWFWIGRRHGPALLARFPRLRRGVDRALPILHRHGASAIFIAQYFYGLRFAAAVGFGVSTMSASRFALLQIVNCTVWALLVGGAGYFFGHAAERFLGEAARVEKYGLIGVLVLAAVIAAVHHLRSRKKPSSGAVC